MTDQELNAIIAEHCGWRFHRPDMAHLKHEATMCWIRPGGSDWQLEQVPNYAGDLNAMHEAENGLTEQQMVTVSQYLHRQLGVLWGFATARQRACALVKALRLFDNGSA